LTPDAIFLASALGVFKLWPCSYEKRNMSIVFTELALSILLEAACITNEFIIKSVGLKRNEVLEL
jgi:hypothetical protein